MTANTAPSVTYTPASFGDLETLRAAKEAADRAERRLREAIDVLPEGIVFLDPEGRYILWNQKYAEIYAKSADLLEPGARLADTLRIGVERGDYPEAAGCEEEWLSHRLSLMENPGVRHEQRLSNGRCIMIEERKTHDGGTIGLRVDITDLKDREESFRLLFEGNPVPLLVYDPRRECIQAANDAALEHFGYAKDEMEGLPASRLFADDEWQEARTVLATNCSEKDRFWRQRNKEGSRLESVLFTRQSVLSGEKATIISVFDVTERRRVEARMAHMARHDELTGLANRAHCRERLYDLLVQEEKPEDLTISLVDLDHFKAVNDTYGHLVGDALLAEAARRMMAQIPKRALLCRIGGDEFAIIFRNASHDQVELVAKSIITALSTPFFIGDHSLHIGATIGSASSMRDSADPETLLRYADLALYAAKATKRGTYRRFELAMDTAAQQRSKLENDFRDAVQKGTLQVHYQPMINLSGGELEGYEALLRWTHPEWGAISPEVFIPLAEDLGLIENLGQFVLRTACMEATKWGDDILLSVNVSPLQFRSGNLLNSVLQALSGSGLRAERLELEITEAVLMDRNPQTLSVIRSLRMLGVGLSMDDFGTGYSSLRYLLSYPFTKIKIDKSFIMSLDEESNSRAVIRAVIGLGSSLGMKVTAEGIEHEAIRDYLRDEGCAQGQGYLFGEARPAHELETKIEQRRIA
ncbi:diguanylate cyclase [Croceicoccus estronivorus]|uniref:putative bifunctional diguanylate cyclase/phosphodiesterase n=1 Tax=Croceicoccus estronivorus TaxID=1172626 RepID=UPI0008335011|nr:EAL domain-containing protein [Croceicoccus estronivorus]OCC24304.1 diguanylate cyclase [Croceicoccus estronivorus]